MIRVLINGSERSLNQLDKQWLHNQIDRRRVDGIPVCVQILINTADMNIILTTADCISNSNGRPPNQHEAQILSMWEHLNLNQKNFTVDNLADFLRQIS